MFNDTICQHHPVERAVRIAPESECDQPSNWTGLDLMPQRQAPRMSLAMPALHTARCVTPDDGRRLATSPPQRIVVLCTGTLRGDNACALAEDIAHVTGASVRAVTVLQPSKAVQMIEASTDDPIETLLTGVTQQLYRTTSLPGLWCLTLLVGEFSNQLERACRNNQADLLILPEAECEEETAVAIWTHTAVPVMCVAASADIVGSAPWSVPYEGKHTELPLVSRMLPTSSNNASLTAYCQDFA